MHAPCAHGHRIIIESNILHLRRTKDNILVRLFCRGYELFGWPTKSCKARKSAHAILNGRDIAEYSSIDRYAPSILSSHRIHCPRSPQAKPITTISKTLSLATKPSHHFAVGWLNLKDQDQQGYHDTEHQNETGERWPCWTHEKTWRQEWCPQLTEVWKTRTQ